MRKSLFILGLLLTSSLCFAKGDAQSGQAKSTTCVACHSADGNSLNPIWPKIAGQHEKYLAAQLALFKKGNDGGRYNPTMSPMAAALSDQDMADLAAFYSKQTMSVGKTEDKYLELGQRIYRGGNLKTHVAACIACHGPKGLGNGPAGFPRIGGQHADYTLAQLKLYQDNGRKNGNGYIMHDVAKRMTLEEMTAVAHYCQGLH